MESRAIAEMIHPSLIFILRFYRPVACVQRRHAAAWYLSVIIIRLVTLRVSANPQEQKVR